jgi:hypothetical protein
MDTSALQVGHEMASPGVDSVFGGATAATVATAQLAMSPDTENGTAMGCPAMSPKETPKRLGAPDYSSKRRRNRSSMRLVKEPPEPFGRR